MHRLVVHIGLGKTGTTALQAALGGLSPLLRQRGVALLSDVGWARGEPSPARPLLCVHRQGPGRARTASAFEAGRSLSRARSGTGHDAEVVNHANSLLAAAFERWNTLVISAESLEPRRKASGLWLLLETWTPRVEVVLLAFVRPQWEMALSRWAQSGWTLGDTSMSRMPRAWLDCYLARYWTWAQHLKKRLPGARLLVRPYRGFTRTAIPGLAELLELLPDCTGLESEAPPGALRNASWPLEAVPGLVLLARKLGSNDASRLKIPLKNRVVHRVQSVSWRESHQRLMAALRYALAVEGLRRHAEGNARLFEDFDWPDTLRPGWFPALRGPGPDWEELDRHLEEVGHESLVELCGSLASEVAAWELREHKQNGAAAKQILQPGFARFAGPGDQNGRGFLDTFVALARGVRACDHGVRLAWEMVDPWVSGIFPSRKRKKRARRR